VLLHEQSPYSRTRAGAKPPYHAPAPSRKPSLRISWYRDLESITALGPAWRDLQSQVTERTVHATHDWVVTWYRHLLPLDHGSPMLAAVWEGSDLVGLAPLLVWNGTIGRVPVHRIDGVGHNWEQGEFLVAAGRIDVYRRLLDAVLAIRGIDLVCLRGVIPGSTGEAVVEEAARSAKHDVRSLPYTWALVPCAGGYEAYLRRMSSNFRHNVRRQEQRMAKQGDVTLDRLRGVVPPEASAPYVNRMFEIGARSWKAPRGGSVNPAYHRFYAELAERFAPQGMLDAAILRIRGSDAAYILGLRDGDRWYDQTISYAEEFASLSPGSYLMQRILRRLADEGVREVVSHGDHQYKRRFTNCFVHARHVFLFSRGPRAQLSRLSRFWLPEKLPFLRPTSDSVLEEPHAN